MPLTLNDFVGLGDPQLNTNWDIFLPDIEGQNVSNLATGIEFNTEASEATPRFFDSSKKYYAGFSDVASFSIDFFEDDEHNVFKYITAWKQLIKDGNGAYNLPKIYKKEITAFLLTNTREIAATYKLTGCFPVGTSPLSFTSEAADAIRPNQEFSVDSVTLV